MTTPATDTDRFSDSHDPLASDLRELTTDRGPATALWEHALSQSVETTHTSIETSVLARLRRPLPPALMAAAAALVLCALLVGILMPSLGKARSSAPRMSDAMAVEEAKQAIDYQAAYAIPSVAAHRADPGGDVKAVDYEKVWGRVVADSPASVSASLSPSPAAAPVPARSVIRKATLEIDTPDVRAAFAKAQMVIRPDLGEFIEGSSLNGESKHAIAQITFRFAVSRMDTALNELRPLGTVKSETASGDDVTAQVVDLDARLRNERRVEQEVLALLESRKDAPLKEILDLRDKLAELRQNIEQLQGRKDSLARQVSLATVLLIIRPVDAPPEEPKSQLTPIGAYFSEQFEKAWRSGTQNLADALSWLIRTVIGGLPWWIALAVIAVFIRRALRRAAPNSPEATWARPPLATGNPASPA